MPLLAAFPLRLRVWAEMGAYSPAAAMLLIFGSAGLILANLRMLLALLKISEPHPWQITETRTQRVLLILGCLLLLVIGILPQSFYPILINFTSLIGTASP
jgi:hypothetical protein